MELLFFPKNPLPHGELLKVRERGLRSHNPPLMCSIAGGICLPHDLGSLAPLQCRSL